MVAAALLVEQGHTVIGVTMKTFCYNGENSTGKTCCGLDGILDARRFDRHLAVLFLAFLGHFAVYRARRYRLSRTLYRGIRFRQTGAAWRYAIRALLSQADGCPQRIGAEDFPQGVTARLIG